MELQENVLLLLLLLLVILELVLAVPPVLHLLRPPAPSSLRNSGKTSTAVISATSVLARTSSWNLWRVETLANR